MQLTIDSLIQEAKIFCEIENRKEHPRLYGISDGKAIGTYIEHNFKEYLKESYTFNQGNSANGIDFPDRHINTDIKVTSFKKPQNSCPFNDISQKIYGLGYNLLLFIYDKKEVDDKCFLEFKSSTFIKSEQTGDYNLTRNLRQMVDNDWTIDEITSYLVKSNIPGGYTILSNLAKKIIEQPPEEGYLTISNAFQWRLKYNHTNEINENQRQDNSFKTKKEYGDYQTPLDFAKRVVEYVYENYDINPDVIIEPTCGIGNFIKASKIYYPDASIIGIDINDIYLNKLENEVNDVTLYNENIFKFDFDKVKRNDKKYLLIGNTPWITNTRLSKYESDNVPQKENIKNYDFFELTTGMSNFDVSENILLNLLKEFEDMDTTLVFLCKYNVACNIFEYMIRNKNYPEKINIIKFNARKVFDIDTSACILIIKLGVNANKIDTCTVNDFYNPEDTYSIGIIDDKFYSRIEDTPDIDGNCPFEWRQGIKHDCIKVMELEIRDDKLYNKQDQEVKIEDNLLYPLLKSSNLKKPIVTEYDKKIIITQHQLKEDTTFIKKEYPQTWKYLNENKELFDNRKSNIYIKAPSFSIFGIGDYTFKKYKVAISGFYKKGQFSLAYNEKSMMLDDTCYYISFDDYDTAYTSMLILNTEIVQKFIKSIAMLDSKRPYTKRVLKRIDISKTLEKLTFDDLVDTERKLKLDRYITEDIFKKYCKSYK